MSFDSKVSGSVDALSLTNTRFKTDSPSLQASFAGDIATQGAGKIDGTVDIQSPQFRTVLDQVGVTLADGDTLKSLKVRGHAIGSFNQIELTRGTYQIDDQSGTGTVGLDMSGSKPQLIANVDLEALDLTPFLGQPSPSQPQQPGWSNETLDLSALQLLNADLSLRAKSIKIGQVSIANADLKALLLNGALNADINSLNAFGGEWEGLFRVNSAASVPTVGFELQASDVAAQTLLGTLAGYDRLSGEGAVTLNVQSAGTSINQIMNKLGGTASLSLDEGALRGINLGQLVRSAGSLREQLASGQLSLANLGDVVSPQSSTDFTNFSTQLDITEGIARIASMKLANSVMDVTGSGQLNLGGRSLDLKLTPAIDRTGQSSASVVQLNGIPVPLRVSGGWSSPSFSPDFSGVRSALESSLRDRAIDAISGNGDSEIGSIVSGVLGSRKGGETDKASGTSDEDAETPVEDEPAETDPESEIKRALGSILNPN